MDKQSPPNPPALWNPNAAACWSLVFSPAFGAFLHARNADALGRTSEAKLNRLWFYMSLAYLGVVVVSFFVPLLPDAAFNAAAIGLLVGWYVSLGTKQIRYVKETWAGGHQRRPWDKPLVVAFAGLVVFMGVIVVASYFAEGS
jgi:hypothetical protein